jgi:hypothetical protein
MEVKEITKEEIDKLKSKSWHEYDYIDDHGTLLFIYTHEMVDGDYEGTYQVQEKSLHSVILEKHPYMDSLGGWDITDLYASDFINNLKERYDD